MLTWTGVDNSNEAVTGGDQVTGYSLEWDQGTNEVSWIVLTKEVDEINNFAFNLTTTVPLPSGST